MIKKLFSSFGLNMAIVTFGVFILLMIFQVYIFLLDPFDVVISIIFAGFFMIPLAILISFQFCFPLLIYSLITKKNLDLRENKFLFLILPIPIIFSKYLVYAVQKLWDMFPQLDFLSMHFNIIVAYFLLIALYFSLADIYYSKFYKKRIKAFFRIVVILLAGILFISFPLHGSQIEVEWISSKAFDQKEEYFLITSEEAYEIILKWEENNESKILSWDEPQLIVEDYYYFPPFEKIMSSLTGYYVNGNTGELEFRISDYNIRSSFWGTPNRIPANIFDSIEILEPGKLENK